MDDTAQSDWRFFRQMLMDWYDPNTRPMPWKGQKNPYFVWLSEIILQQTRVEQGWSYFEKFKANYPNVHALADAPDEQVMKDWEGLGYYSRARNLLKAARIVSRERGGDFPKTYKELLALPGVGPYTAAAIASFAFGEAVAVLDGNVYRILSRYAGIDTAIDTTEGKKLFALLAKQALDVNQPAAYNQAIMDFGALVCKPKQAACEACNLNTTCVAFANEEVYTLPVKAKKIKKRTRYFHFLVAKDTKGYYVIQQRTKKDIWQDLYQFPMLETEESNLDWNRLVEKYELPDIFVNGQVEYRRSYPLSKQQLTHQTIIACFHEVRVSTPWASSEEFIVLDQAGLSQKAFPKVIASFIEEKDVFLDLFSQ